MTGSNQSTALDEMCTERLAMAQENQAARKQQTEMTQQIMSMFMQFQQMMSGVMNGVGPNQSFQQGPMSFHGPPTHFDPRQQQQQQQQQQPPQSPPLIQQQQQELRAQHQQQELQIYYSQQQDQHHQQQQQHAQQSPQRNQQLFQSAPPPHQHQHPAPEQHQPDVSRHIQGPRPSPTPSGQLVPSQQHRHPQKNKSTSNTQQPKVNWHCLSSSSAPLAAPAKHS
jgi:hypothetical protein